MQANEVGCRLHRVDNATAPITLDVNSHAIEQALLHLLARLGVLAQGEAILLGEADPVAQGGPRAARLHERAARVALELFTAQGFEQTSLREIRERLGTTKAAVSYRCRSREQLTAAVIESTLMQVDAIVA